MKEKAGPRHFRFTRDEKFVYLLNELDASIYVLPYDARSGTMGKELQVVSAMPEGFNGKPWAAEIQLTPDGKPICTHPSAPPARLRGSRSTPRPAS